MVWPKRRSTQEETGSSKSGAKLHPPVTNCSFRPDGNSQGTNISSLASTATKETNTERTNGIMMNAYQAYQNEQDQMNSFEGLFNNKEEMFSFEEDEDILQQMTPRKRTAGNDITSPSGVVTESSERLQWEGVAEKLCE
jgi:hypothetical protein